MPTRRILSALNLCIILGLAAACGSATPASLNYDINGDGIQGGQCDLFAVLDSRVAIHNAGANDVEEMAARNKAGPTVSDYHLGKIERSDLSRDGKIDGDDIQLLIDSNPRAATLAKAITDESDITVQELGQGYYDDRLSVKFRPAAYEREGEGQVYQRILEDLNFRKLRLLGPGLVVGRATPQPTPDPMYAEYTWVTVETPDQELDKHEASLRAKALVVDVEKSGGWTGPLLCEE